MNDEESSGADAIDAYSVALRYTMVKVIRSFRHKGIQKFFETGSKAGIQPKHAARLALQLDVLDDSVEVDDMRVPGWKRHALSGELAGYWAVSVSGNWRLTFTFEAKNAVLVDYQDYH